jgi:hypothetical protein
MRRFVQQHEPSRVPGGLNCEKRLQHRIILDSVNRDVLGGGWAVSAGLGGRR